MRRQMPDGSYRWLGPAKGRLHGVIFVTKPAAGYWGMGFRTPRRATNK